MRVGEVQARLEHVEILDLARVEQRLGLLEMRGILLFVGAGHRQQGVISKQREVGRSDILEYG